MTGHRKLFSLLLRFAVLAIPSIVHANLVQNGNFAGGSGDQWTFNYGPTVGPPVAPFTCGIDCGFLSTQVDGEYGWFDPWDLCQCTISQDLATTAGQTYRVTYLFGLQVDVESPGRFGAWFGGNMEQSAVGAFTGPGIHPVPWQIQNIAFLATATTSSSRIEFGGLCPGCNFLVADVSVVPVPSPGTLSLVGFGLFGAAVTRRRKPRSWRRKST